MTIKSITKSLLTVLFIATLSYGKAQIVSTFDSSAEGWRTITTYHISPQYNQTGGNPGGYVSFTDNTSGIWYWAAPAKFLGNQESSFGRLLQFDLKQSALNDQFYQDDVIITGAGITIACDLDSNPGINWTHYNVPLDTTLTWKIDSINGPLATSADIRSVLSDITDLRIRGEFITGNDVGSLDNVILPSTVLPIYLLSFIAKTQSDKVLLQWLTSSEINSLQFVVEHSADGLDFSSIGSINAAANSTTIQKYTFDHNSPINGINFYRLKMVDKNDSYNYSQIVKVVKNQKADINIFPNPMVNKFTISGLPVDFISKIQLLDMSGKILTEQTTNAASLDMDISKYPSGIYLIKIFNNNQFQQLRIKKR